MSSELWAIVEVMGHSAYAGKVSEYTALGVPLVRVEVPATKHEAAFEKLLGATSIFRITPCTEEAAKAAAEQFRVSPLSLVNLPSARPALAYEGLGNDGFGEDDDDDDDDADDEEPEDPLLNADGTIRHPVLGD